MKQALKNEMGMLNLMNKIQTQIFALEKKIDTLINRSLPETKLPPMPSVSRTSLAVGPHESKKARTMYPAICADCKKDCSIPFKPSADRPVYCQDCYSRRKVIRLSKIGIDDKHEEVLPVRSPVNKVIDVQKPPIKKAKKTASIKKSIGKKKTVPKKK